MADGPKDDGESLPVDIITNEQLARLWVFPIFPVLKGAAPSRFKADAGLYDWKTNKMDRGGFSAKMPTR